MVSAASYEWVLNLLGCWQLRLNGQPVDIGIRQQRLIAVLALLGTRSRPFIASLLWPDSSEGQASGNLRAGVFLVSHRLPRLLGDSTDPLALGADVSVDIQQVRLLISEIELAEHVPTDAAELLRTAGLLPGWYEDWVVFEQERFQQQRLCALDTLSSRYLTLGHIRQAMEAASAAIAIEPLRETSQLLLVRTHLAADDRASAERVFRAFRTQLQHELGIAPSPTFAALLNHEAAVRSTHVG